MNIAKALKQIRWQNQVTQREMAKYLCISSSYLCEIENDKKSPSLSLIVAFGDKFNLKASEVVKLAEEMA